MIENQNNQYGFVDVADIPQPENDKIYELFSHRTGGLCYLLALLLPQLIGGLVLVAISSVWEANSDPYLFMAYFVTQAVMALSLLLAVNFKVKNALPRMHFEKPQRKSDLWLMLPFSVALLFGLNFIPGLFLTLMEQFGYVMEVIAFPDTTSALGFILGIICICVLPAIVEESIFRGVILRSFGSQNAWKGILISSALFSLMHGSAQQTMYQFVIGIVLGLVAVKTNSIYPSMLLHFLNNAISVVLLFFTEAEQMAFMTYAFVPCAILTGLMIGYFVNRKTPNLTCVEESLGITPGSVHLQGENGNICGMSRDISQSEIYIRKAKKYQAIIFYSCGILFGIFTWVTMMMMGF